MSRDVSVLEAITSFYSRGKYCWGTSIRFSLFCALINYEKLMFNGNRKTKKMKVINSVLLLINILPIPKMFYIFLRGSVEPYIMRSIWPRQKNVKEECQQTWVEWRSTVLSNKSTVVRLLQVKVSIVRYVLCIFELTY